MRTKKYKIVILSLLCLNLIFTQSCTKSASEIDNTNAITLDCTKAESDTLRLSRLFPLRFFLPLETTERALVGQVAKIAFADSLLLVQDGQSTGNLYAFHRQTGRYLWQYGAPGHGRGEYTQLNDFAVNEAQGRVYLLAERSRLLAYGLDGTYEETRDLPFFATNLECSGGTFFFVCDERPSHNLRITDRELKTVAEYFPNEAYGDNYVRILHPLQKGDHGVLYRRYLDNRIYEARPDGSLSAAYEVDLGDGTVDADRLEQLSKAERKADLAEGKGHVKYFTEGSDYCFCVYFDQERPQFAFHDRAGEQTRVYDFALVQDSLLGEPPLLEFADTQGNLVGVAYGSAVRRLFEAGQLGGAEYSEDSNPVLCFYRKK